MTCRIATFNVNSLRSRIDVLEPWINKNQPHILCLQETKVQDSDFPRDLIKSWGYQVVFNGQKTYNGVAILSKEEPDQVIRGFCDGQEPDFASRMIAARFNDLWVVNTYVPQGKSIDHPDYETKKIFLRRAAQFCQSKQGDLLWCGDLNVAPTPLDVANPQTKTKHVCYYQELRDLFHELTASLVDLFRTQYQDQPVYSFFDYRVKNSLDRNLGWRIDHLLASPSLAQKMVSCQVDHQPRRAEKPSDHCPIFADFNLN